jgi:queuine/archaeosine tRNA-ribosyltransferase
MGYRRIALGGMVPLRTPDILASLEAIGPVRKRALSLHLLGVTRVNAMSQFAALGVDSFDSTSPFRQAFMDDRNNYHTPTNTYVAIRVPQVDGNPALKRAILGGVVSQKDAIRVERACLRSLRAYDAGTGSIDAAMENLAEYEQLLKPRRTYLEDYKRTLEEAPWKLCACSICREWSVEVAIFRGTERNKRRGFHNVAVFGASVRELGMPVRGVAKHAS